MTFSEKSRAFLASFDNLKEQFWEKGYVVIPKAFSQQEVALVKRAIIGCEAMNERFRDVKAKFDSGKKPSFESIFVMNDVFGNDVFSKMTRNYKLIDMVSYLFDDDAYVYHNKVTLKYSNSVGFKFHQDYFYWYQMGCLFPQMATCFIALDAATEENGCLRLMPGSHKMGRVEHTLFDGFSDSEVEAERLNAAKQRFDEVPIALSPGDAVLFHCNLFHGSHDNLSDHSRLALLGCYNTKANSPINRRWSHPPYAPQSRFFGPLQEEDVENLPDFSVTFEQASEAV
ncbi:phytanoyl-CoA dioxygenase family protein [Aestuariibacter halophilus]|uniref:Phytanoyl-CoA dioxygenase family protein n=1 Tax=Fluctibacter halophilus TaxID=226011 RepID=A0ABS8G9P3_9ALTE|nr:phytanoyl-CoA dioxygenase family protein [Aestuariibacter halophilus]MCC2617228.1 phytanoyl-CoA dioxygenase family protein [Aestuariibacter halophilus]